jgi:hypothetical protein
MRCIQNCVTDRSLAAREADVLAGIRVFMM